MNYMIEVNGYIDVGSEWLNGWNGIAMKEWDEMKKG